MILKTRIRKKLKLQEQINEKNTKKRFESFEHIKKLNRSQAWGSKPKEQSQFVTEKSMTEYP